MTITLRSLFQLTFVLFWSVLPMTVKAENQIMSVGNDKSMRTLFLENTLLPIGQEVRADLQLTSQQEGAIRKYKESSSRYTLGIHWVQACQRDLQGILSQLDETQKRRYVELVFQYRGALGTFLIPKIAGELKLTPPQERQLEELYAMHRAGVKNLNDYEVKLLASKYSQGKFSSPLKRAADMMAESILTPDQHLIWRGMQGRIIDPRPSRW